MSAELPPSRPFLRSYRRLNCFELICDNHSIDTRRYEWWLLNVLAGAPEIDF